MSLRADQIPSVEPVARALVMLIEAAYAIECAGCGDEQTVCGSSAWNAANEFAIAGWQVVDNEVKCGDCVAATEDH